MQLAKRHKVDIPAYSVSTDRWRDFDWILFVTMGVLMTFGAISIWSAVGLPNPTQDILNDGNKHLLFGAAGLVLFAVFASIDYRYLEALVWPAYVVGLLSLIAVQSPLGVEIAGAQNWINLGFTLIQPSEFTKVTTVLAMASYVAGQGAEMRRLSNFVIAALIVGLPSLLILIGPDLGQTMVYVAIWLSTLLAMRTNRAWIWTTVLSLPALGLFAWEFVLEPYQKTRLLVSFDPDSAPLEGGWQILHARTAIGAGGLFGEGLRGGTQSTLNLLGVAESDFIFAHASGMFGFVGMIGLMTAMVILIWRCINIAEVARDHFGQMIAIAAAGMFFFQATLNIGMNVGLMPVAGITLPFVSAGVSSLWTSMVFVGILQSIRMHHRKLGFQPL